MNWKLTKGQSEKIFKNKLVKFVHISRNLLKIVPNMAKELWMISNVADALEPYIISGIAVDQSWLYKHQKELEQYAMDEMRESGLVPVFDVSPGLNKLEYDAKENVFNYEIEIKGYRVGTPRSYEIMGLSIEHGLMFMKNGSVSIAKL